MFSTVGDIINLGDILSTVGDIMSTVGGYLEYREGYHDARGGILSVAWGCSVPWEDATVLNYRLTI